jgi:hypothetical protein
MLQKATHLSLTETLWSLCELHPKRQKDTGTPCNHGQMGKLARPLLPIKPKLEEFGSIKGETPLQ